MSTRGATQSWNVFVERRLPLDIATSVGYVGTRTDGGYASRNLNYAESGGNANRQLFAQAGTANISTLASLATIALPLAAGGREPSLQERADAEGRLHVEQGHERGRTTMAGALTWNQPSQFHRNYALAGFDRPHMLQLGFVYELPFARNSSHPLALVVKDWQINGIASWLSGTPFTVGGDNGLLQQQGGSQTINVTGEPQPGFGDGRA